MTRLIAALGLIVVLCTAPALAQEVPGVDEDRWETLSKRAATMVENETAEDPALEAMRKRLTEYRAEFEAASGLNANRIKILRDQIAALGTPAEGEQTDAEPPDVASKRAELTAELNTLLAPVQTAEAAFLEANGLIEQIDAILRERQAARLLQLGPSPFNPMLWDDALVHLQRGLQLIWQTETPATDRAADDLRQKLPLIFFAALLGLVLILRGHVWATMIVGRLRRKGARGLGIWRFVVSLLRILLPYIGIVALALAADMTGYFGPRGSDLLALIPTVGALMLGFRWVSERVFSRDDDEALLLVDQGSRQRGRFYVGAITAAIVIDVVLRTVMECATSDEGALAVVTFPVTLIIAFSLFQIGRILRHYADPAPADTPDDTPRVSTFSRVVNGLGLGAVVVAIAAPVLKAIGYFNAGEAILQPYVLTLVLLGLVMALQRFSADVYGALTGQGAEARDALMPVLFGMLLLMLVAPLLALAWGARVSDLAELWGQFSRGFAIGETRISPTDFLTFAVIFALGYILTRVIQSALRSNVLPKTKMDIGGQNAIVSGLGYFGIFLAAVLAITGAGIDLSSLAIVAGALSVGIGFGLQNIVSNFVSGIILLIERPISEGDWIEVGGQMGYVRDISVRSTRIETFDRTDVIVPNADLVSGTVTNFTRGNTVGRVIVPVGVAYGTDTRKVDRILREIAEAHPMVLMNPPPTVLLVNFGADSLEFEIRAILRDVNWTMPVKNDLNHSIAERFVAEGIEIPFAQRDLWLRNPEVLQDALRARQVSGEPAADAPSASAADDDKA